MKNWHSILATMTLIVALFAGCAQENSAVDDKTDTQSSQSQNNSDNGSNKESYNEDDFQSESMMGSNEKYENPTSESEKLDADISMESEGKLRVKVTYDGSPVTDATVTGISVPKSTDIQDIDWMRSSLYKADSPIFFYEPSDEKFVLRIKKGDVYKQIVKDIKDLSSNNNK
ncbi:hypothetical protein ACX17C_27405 [Bacillus cereus]